MAGYLGSVPVPQATQHRETFTATAAQTTFNTAGYTPQFIDVYLNGVHLSPADVTATNGSDVVLAACLVNDIVDVVSYTPFEVASPVFTGSATFNEGSADADFRVESNGNANMLFVDGGNDTVAIGTSDTDFDPVADNLIVGTGSGSHGITIYTGGSVGNKGSIFFADTPAGDATNSRKGQISYEQNNEIMTFFTNDTKAMEISIIGAVTKPLQPAFQVKPTSAQNNIAANNSSVTVVFGTEVFDQNDDFASNTFTAPVTGRYQLNANLYLLNLDSASEYYYLRLNTSNRVYDSIITTNRFSADVGYATLQISVLADMDASDQSWVSIVQQGGTAQTDIGAAATNFSGYLVA